MRVDECGSKSEWMSTADQFANSVCELWELPKLPEKQSLSIGVIGERLVEHTISNVPGRQFHEADLVWGMGSTRFAAVVDCQILENLMAGRAYLLDADTRPIFVRIGRSITALHSAGLCPRTNAADYIEWRPRAFNKVADHLCNMALDTTCSRQHVDTAAIAELWARRCHFQFFSDGGLRTGQRAALGWILYGVICTPHQPLWTVLAWKSTYMEASLSSFTLEAMALEDGLAFFTSTVLPSGT